MLFTIPVLGGTVDHKIVSYYVAWMYVCVMYVCMPSFKYKYRYDYVGLVIMAVDSLFHAISSQPFMRSVGTVKSTGYHSSLFLPEAL